MTRPPSAMFQAPLFQLQLPLRLPLARAMPTDPRPACPPLRPLRLLLFPLPMRSGRASLARGALPSLPLHQQLHLPAKLAWLAPAVLAAMRIQPRLPLQSLRRAVRVQQVVQQVVLQWVQQVVRC